MHSAIHKPSLKPVKSIDGWNHQQLRERAAVFMKHYPDLHSLAHKAARDIIQKHTGQKSLDPATVYWHRFTTAVSSDRTFTGYRHTGRPSESMTLIELLMHRFSAADQDASDDLNVYGGFYTVGPDHQSYDEHNEVPMLPSQVLRDFWDIDFAADCKNKVETFWNDHRQDFCTFAMIRVLSAAGVALNRRHMRMGDFQTVLAAITGGFDTRVSWAMVNETRAFPPGISMQLFKLAGLASRDMLCISDAEGRQILYQPDHQPAFLCFADDHALNQWVQAQIAEPATRYAFASHFTRDRKQQTLFVTKLAKLGDQAWRAQPLSPQSRRAGAKPVFKKLRDRAQQEMRDDVQRQLTTSASLRKQMWIGYLSAFIHVAGGFAPLGWPIALTLIGAGVANVGLNIDQAISGRTSQLRKAGVVGAVVNSVYLLFNLPLLTDISRPTLSMQSAASEAESGLASLEGLEGNVVLQETAPVTDIDYLRGVHVLENGDTWISLKGLPYRVQYLDDLKIWYVVNPDNPFSFSGARLVRLNELGEWECVGAPKLLGGMLSAGGAVHKAAAAPFETVSSAFWDTYMQFNLAEEQRLSALGNQRQESVVSVYELDSDEEVVSGEEGEDVVVDHFGDTHRVFRSGEDWFGGRIGRYTDDDDIYNFYLRTGQPRGDDQVQEIERLIEDLAEVAHNNDVPLYRGGSGNRGTSGKVFRDGKFKIGDVLVNTDFTSFSENPYIARVFASSQGGAVSESYRGAITFDDTSVVFELPAKQYLSATPVSPFSFNPNEVESVFVPGNYFEIQRIQEVAGSHYRFMNVQLKQIPVEQVSGLVYDLRTGVPFSRDQYASKLGAGAKVLVDTFFPPSAAPQS